MYKSSIPVLIWLLFSITILPQTITIPSVALEKIEFKLHIGEIPDTLTETTLTIKGDDYEERILLPVVDGEINTFVKISETGNFEISIKEKTGEPSSIKILPGILSIVPPLLAIFLALLVRQVIVSLLAGIYIGTIFIYNYNPLTALLRLIDTYLMNVLVNPDNMAIIVFSMLFGGVVGLISNNGGTKGMANVVIKFAKNRRSGLVSTWLLGLFIFFDDYANTLIVGNLMRPITDKFKVSREKLSFIVDSTSAPVASIVLISTWIGYEVGLINDGLKLIGSTESAYEVFISTIPYRFYPITMIFFVFLVIWMRRDFSLMHKAEVRAIEKGELIRPGSKPVQDLTDSTNFNGDSNKERWYNGLVPIIVIVAGTITGMLYSGIWALEEAGQTEFGLRDIISNADAFKSLLWASFAACIVAVIMTVSQRILSLSDTIDAWYKGIRSMLLAMIILILAWSISSITEDIKTADYLVSILSDSLNPRFLPVLVFLLCALTSFATGTSWGIMAIMMPIVIPLAHSVSAQAGLSPADTTLIIHGVISSVLAGSIFGDHCSPIADTTILSSMATACDHIDHVKTQLPYAILVAVLCMLFGDIPTAFGISPFISIIIIMLLLWGILFLFGKKLPVVKS